MRHWVLRSAVAHLSVSEHVCIFSAETAFQYLDLVFPLGLICAKLWQSPAEIWSLQFIHIQSYLCQVKAVWED